MIKITETDTSWIVQNNKNEIEFFKGSRHEPVKMLQHIVFTLGLNTDSYTINIAATPE